MIKKNPKNPNKINKNQLIFGNHSVEAALLNDKRTHNELILHENTSFPIEKYKSKIKKVKFLDHKQFKKQYGNQQSTQGIVLKTSEHGGLSLKEFLKIEKKHPKSVIIVLDQITDPQNIGSIMRSCALFNCNAIVVAKDNSPELTPALLKVASGAAELVNYIKVTNLRRSLLDLKKNGYWVYCFDSSDNNTSEINFENKSVLVFGSEGNGIRDLIKKECDIFIKLKTKSIKKYKIDSLNVSNATAIALHEFYKN